MRASALRQLLMRTRTRGIMTLLAAGRGLSLLNSLPTTLGRSGGRCTHAFCLAALTTQRHVLLGSSPVFSIHDRRISNSSTSSSSSRGSSTTSSLQRASSTWGVSVPPRHESLRISTALSAKGSSKRGESSKGSSSSSNSSNNSNIKRQLSSSSNRAAADAARPGSAGTRAKGGTIGSLAGPEQPAVSRPAWTGPRLAGPRPVAATAVAGAGAVDWTSPYTGSAGRGGGGGGTGGGRGQTRGLHENGPAQPDGPPEIPEDQLEVSFSRSSGAGGQNVNKLSTKVEMRFVVSDADWLPHDVRLRLARQQSGRMNNRGELVVTAQEFRTQRQNRSQALHKLQEMVEEAWEPAKERKLRTGISKAGKEARKADKRHRSQVKAGRSKVGSGDFD